MSELTIVGAFIAGTVFGGAITLSVLATMIGELSINVRVDGDANDQ